MWLNIVHRMDMRKLVITKKEEGEVLLQAAPVPEGVRAKLEPHRPALDRQQLAMTLMQWGTMAFARPSDLRTALA